MKIRSMSAIFLGALVLSFTSSLHATTLYNNLSASTYSEEAITESGPLAASFSTGAFSGDLSSVTLDLYEPSDTDTGTITVDLFSDNSTAPGTVLETIGTIDASSLSIGNSSDSTLNTSYALDANTRYWIELSTEDSAAEWAYADDTSGTGVAGEYYYGDGNVSPNGTDDSGPYQMDVEGVSASPVPEPPALLLLGTGLLGLLALKLRRRLSSVSEGDFMVGNVRF